MPKNVRLGAKLFGMLHISHPHPDLQKRSDHAVRGGGIMPIVQNADVQQILCSWNMRSIAKLNIYFNTWIVEVNIELD